MPNSQFDRAALQPKIAALADRGVFIGTSSWKYPGWRGLLYDEARYLYRGKVAESRFEKQCLAEYAEVFKTVCVDGAYYRFPDRRYLEGMVSQVPGDFQFGFKVTDEITVKRFTNLPRFGVRAGKPNENFLIPLAMQHYLLLQRNLVYTGITRGRKLVVLIGQKKALAMAVRNNRTERRFSGLLERLKVGSSG